MLFPHSATVQASTKVGTNYTYVDTGSTICFLQPLSDQETQLYGMTFGKGFNCYLPFTSVVADKMRLIIDGVTYGVKGIKTYTFGSLKHKRALLEAL